jgi:hypothetical protein
MASFPSFILYESNGVTPVYEFDCVTDINDWQDPADFVEHTSLRGQGSIITEGSSAPWDLTLTFVLRGTDYEDLTSQMSSLLTNIEKFTKYVFKVQTTSGGSTKDYKVMRLGSFTFPLDRDQKRVKFQTAQVTFRVDSWA